MKYKMDVMRNVMLCEKMPSLKKMLISSKNMLILSRNMQILCEKMHFEKF